MKEVDDAYMKELMEVDKQSGITSSKLADVSKVREITNKAPSSKVIHDGYQILSKINNISLFSEFEKITNTKPTFTNDQVVEMISEKLTNGKFTSENVIRGYIESLGGNLDTASVQKIYNAIQDKIKDKLSEDSPNDFFDKSEKFEQLDYILVDFFALYDSTNIKPAFDPTLVHKLYNRIIERAADVNLFVRLQRLEKLKEIVGIPYPGLWDQKAKDRIKGSIVQFGKNDKSRFKQESEIYMKIFGEEIELPQ